ncbi:hypothetical protein J4446_02045 [Candidatus Woesearchaeota archaeon]|nr:hypothetical protein [Candidatus Woesearchaeota archaeon]
MKRGQFWYSDFVIGFSILAIIGLLFVSAMVDISLRNQDTRDIFGEIISISNNLRSSGYLPYEWQDGNGRIGLIDSSRVNFTKLTLFQDLDYTKKSKVLLGTTKDFVFYFENKQGMRLVEYGNNGFFGDPAINDMNSIKADTILKFTRFVFLNGQIVKMVVVMWE